MNVLGVDVCKKELACFSDGRSFAALNTKAGIVRLLKGLEPSTAVAMESTGQYHLPLADAAHGAGFEVYVLNPKDVKRYRDAVAARGKTDPLDAEVIARFVDKEHAELRAYVPAPASLRSLRSLIMRRKTVSASIAKMRLSLGGVPELAKELKGICKRMEKAIERIDAMILVLAKEFEDYQRLKAIPGIGPLCAAAFTCELRRGDFRSADSFVAFLGLDLIANDSGMKRGRRKLSKLGNSEIRRLAFMAALAGAKCAAWKAIYLAYCERMSRTQALVALSRRMIRTAWSLSRHKTEFKQERLGQGLDKRT